MSEGYKVQEKDTSLSKIHLTNEKFPTDEESKGLRVENFKAYFSQYCEGSSIHGIKYVGERGRYLFEKIMWTTIIFFVCAICLVFIHHVYLRWRSSPVIVTFATSETSISKIPFPAVTLCPEVKFNKEIFNYTELYAKKVNNATITEEEYKKLQYASLVCDEKQIFNTSSWNRTLAPSIKEILYKMQSPVNASIKWLGKVLKLDDVFLPTFTDDGICFTFNMLPEKEVVKFENEFTASLSQSIKSNRWSMEDGYSYGANFDAYPRRAFMPGLDGGLSIDDIITNSTQFDHFCKGSLQGFKVALHHPCELPNMEKHFLLPLDQAVLVSVKPTLVTVSEELLTYPPKARKCYFNKEKYLASYMVYTEQNCLEECLANYTLLQCGCVPFYFPLPRHDAQYCGPGSNGCIKQSKLRYMEIESNIGSDHQQCKCLPSCTSLSYDVETSQVDYNSKEISKFLKAYKNVSLSNDLHTSKLNVYYTDLQFLGCERKELYGTVHFFSDMGGLLGLFIGFSVTSAIEILYFCTLRLICNIIKYGKCEGSGRS